MMFGLCMDRAANRAGSRRRLAWIAVCLVTLLNSTAEAQPDRNEIGVDPCVFVLPDDDFVPTAQSREISQPVLPKPVTAADLPPSNPLLAGSIPRMSALFGRDWRASRNEYRAIVEREAKAFGLPPPLVDAIMAVESRYNASVVGLDGEIGLMQVMPSTARMLGFTGSLAELAAPEVNVHYGTKYLAGAWHLAGGDLCTAAMKYRAGHGETRFSFLSVDYCLRVRSHLVAQGVAITGSVPQPTFGSAGGAHARRVRSGAAGIINFAALNTRLREISDRKVVRGH